ncbi:MAG TPA: efflux RND transporter periplasmic adaptor subunit [Pseudonocardiaceae bacterium]|jgi:HlyD family secretion protein|nr:efflux RND transporter periplasmic adaptor subunit [Pseudonocardiaceae bacterium]
MAERGKRGWRPTRRLLIIVGVAVIALGGGIGAWAATRSTSDTYRFATAGPATVTSTLNATGTIEPVSEATVGFPVSGQVASVNVRQGQQVTSGQTLAQLNTNTLAASVSSEQSTVATAEAKLASDQASQNVVTTADTTKAPTAGGAGSSGGSSSNSAANAKLAALAKGLSSGQTAVLNAQKQVDTDLTLVGAEVASDQNGADCPQVIAYLKAWAAEQPPTSSTPPAGGSGSGSTSPSDTPTPPTSPPSPTTITNCQTLMQQVLTDEGKASTDEHTLSAAEATLSTALSNATAAVSQATGSTSSSSKSNSTTNPQSAGGSSSSGTGHTTSANSGPASADQIAADQASTDAANAQLAEAQQNMAAATLLSPISGTVAEVDLTAGENTSANSTTANIVIVGPGVDEVTTAVSDSQVGQVKPGQAVDVAPDGSTTPIAGHVSEIGALASTTSSGTASYPVTISLGNPTQQLFAGATASVAITLDTAQAAVTVPTSAVHSIAGFSFVSMLVNGKLTQTRVQLGVQGADLTQITSGLKAGQQVVLADLSTALPTSGSTTTRGGAGALAGGGGGAARFAGGGGGGFAGGGAAGGAGGAGGAKAGG